jgi:hypothetical protein
MTFQAERSDTQSVMGSSPPAAAPLPSSQRATKSALALFFCR